MRLRNRMSSEKNKLQEWCHRNNRQLPIYRSFQNENNQWVATVQIDQNESKGDPAPRKVDSENSAARNLLAQLTANPSASNRWAQQLDELRSVALMMREMYNAPHDKYFDNVFSEEFIQHLQILVRNKPVEISLSGFQDRVPVQIHIQSGIQQIHSQLQNNIVRVEIPRITGFEQAQAMMLFSLCMEIGAHTCIVSVPDTMGIQNIILQT